MAVTILALQGLLRWGCRRIMPPTRPPKNIHPFGAEIGGIFNITHHVSKFMKNHFSRIVRFWWLCYTEHHFFAFRLKSAKHFIPNNEEHAHVTVNILVVLAVVYPVVAGGNKNMLQPAHFFNEFGMHKNAPDLGGGVDKSNVYRPNASKSQRYKIKETVQRLKNRRAEAYGKIEMLGAVVCNMDGPEKAHLMVKPVQPIVHKVLR